VRLLEGFAGAAALALDTARCVDRVRTAGADAERARIAGELHDQVGQSLAYLGFELDRLSRHSPDEELRPGIDEVRTGLRAAMGELRDALHDLRADVSERRSLEAVLESVVPRVRRRTGAAVTLERSGPEGVPARLPLVHERALWRIAEEALTNAERHATAGAVTVRWHSDGVRATLEVVDDGRGFDPDAVEALPARHGLAGMRRRAASVGATVEVRSAPGAGTLVRCRLGQP
jgi:signal transduction histidine kinase